MFRQDFIKRQIALFAEVLARLAGHRKNGEPEQALAEARNEFRTLGVDPNLLELDARSLVRMLRDREKLEAICTLLDELAACHDALAPGAPGARTASRLMLTLPQSAAELRAQAGAIRAELGRAATRGEG
jgi:hypothetical protein